MKFIAWLGIALVAVGAGMLLLVAVAVLSEGLWPLTIVFGMLGLMALGCVVEMARLTIRG